VLDEADRMLHMGFSKELNAILGNTPKDRQTSMFSATFANDVQNLAKQYLKPNHVFIRVGREGSTTELIEQRFIFMSNALAGRFPKLLEILKSPQECKKTLIFSNTKDGASNIYHRLSEKGYEVGVLHGDIGQASRDNAMRRFRNSETGILVATEVAARGIDVKDIEYVINYDLPKSIDDYVHRIGRTGRTGKKGVSISFFSPENQNIAKDLVALLKEAKQVVPKELEQFASNYGGTSFGEGRRFGSSGGGGGSYSYRPSYNNRGSSFYNNNYSNRDSNSGNKRRKFDYDDHDDDDDDGDSYKFAGSSRSSSDWSGGNNKSKKNYDFSFLKE
jgi:superfamily II DNA/RNA helicase